MGPHQEVVGVHRRHGLPQRGRHLRPLAAKSLDAIESVQQLKGGRRTRPSLSGFAPDGSAASSSWLKYSRFWQKSNTLKQVLWVARPEQALAEPGAAPEHLPELGLRPHQLEEHQIDHLGHVDAGVEHVHGDGDVGRLVLVGEVVDQALAVAHLVGDHPSEVPGVERRIVGVEPLLDEIGVALVLGEDDRLAQPVAAAHLDALSHEVLEHPIHGVLVEQPLVQLSGHPPYQGGLSGSPSSSSPQSSSSHLSLSSSDSSS